MFFALLSTSAKAYNIPCEVIPLNIISYLDQYRKQVEAITVATSSKAAFDPIHRQFSLAMYCDGYLDHGLVYLLEENQQIFGYIMCAPDLHDYLKKSLPQQKIIASLPDYYLQRAQREWQQYKRHEKDYPAHMHINLKKEARGQHYGTALINKLLEALKDHHVKGLMLGVDRGNKGAIRFYSKNGFAILEENDDSYLMGIQI